MGTDDSQSPDGGGSKKVGCHGNGPMGLGNMQGGGAVILMLSPSPCSYMACAPDSLPPLSLPHPSPLWPAPHACQPDPACVRS